MSIEERYNFARIQAQALGSSILGYYNEVLYRNKIKDKGIRNFPTEADLQASKLISDAIAGNKLTRNDAVISEESYHDSEYIVNTIENSEYVWTVDPLDGTLNFAYGFPYFCVSLGLLKNREPVLGVIYNPPTQELYCAQKGQGAVTLDLRNGSRRPLKLESSKSELADCMVMTHLSGKPDARRAMLGVMDQMMERCRYMRMLGSGQMALVSLALGQFDIFFNYKTHIWDIVPGFVILSEAHGYVCTSMNGRSLWDYRSRGIIAASNPAIGQKFKDFIKSELKREFPRY